jgi:DNA mismatch endonuclease (patch repair protein)
MVKDVLFDDVPEVVRRRMARIGKKDTKPELVVRRLLHGMGYRFRLHRQDLPGTPDVIFASRRKVIFVHGCFWHRHGCHLAGRLPRTRQEYWGPKLDRNVERDRAVETALIEQGWRALTIWECELGDPVTLAHRLRSFLDDCIDASSTCP